MTRKILPIGIQTFREIRDRALQHIKERGYADRFRADGRPIHLIGVEFSRERRQVVGFAVGTLS